MRRKPRKISLLECYEILKIAKDATLDDVKHAYRLRAFELHPDLNPDDPLAGKKFQQLNEAYVALSALLEARQQESPKTGDKGEAKTEARSEAHDEKKEEEEKTDKEQTDEEQAQQIDEQTLCPEGNAVSRQTGLMPNRMSCVICSTIPLHGASLKIFTGN